jgi:hypothetical protein
MLRTVRIAVTASALAATLCSQMALAGIADSPLPVLEAGKRTYHLYSVSGVIEQGILSTYFACTSTDTAAMRVGVEPFKFLGGTPTNDTLAAESVTVAPGGTVLFGTRSPVWTAIDVPLTVGGNISRGSARILATSKKLTCTAFVADANNAPPTSAWQLTIIKTTKQKGD